MKDLAQHYPGFDTNLLSQARKRLYPFGFTYSSPALRGALFVHKEKHLALLLDHLICDRRFKFSYTEYTREQNQLMHLYQGLFRFITDDMNELEQAAEMLGRLLEQDFSEEGIKVSGRDRELTEADPTMPEAYFEQAFIDCYGRPALDRVLREMPVIDLNGRTRWVDYFIRRKEFDIAIEKNGEIYHHPIITGKKQYNSQLIKQNSLVAYGAKVFRWSIPAMQFTDNFAEEMKLFFGDPKDFLLGQKVSASRGFKLFDHQENVLDGIHTEREKGNGSFLVVLPTGTGKTEVLIADFAREFKAEKAQKTLIMVPTKQLKSDHMVKFQQRLADHDLSESVTVGETRSCNVMVQTYAWMSRHYHKFENHTFDYIAVDEAHHAVAPTARKVIQHFNPGTLIGFTATDKRPDNNKLESIFGQYQTDLSLPEAIRQGLLAPIKAFRVKSNIDLSQVRFNGKDYMATDLQNRVIVPSRDQLIVDVLLKYFVSSEMPRKQGIVFCVSIQHARDMAKRMKENKISAMAVSGSDNKSSSYIQDYQNGKLQFLTTCSLLNEGWDSPQTAIIVMARPTMSKVLYAQQLGRGTRKHPGKEALYVIDVVDNYGGINGFHNRPWSVHALLGMPDYMPWANILKKKSNNLSREEVILAGLYEEERILEQINIFTFESEYPDHISDEQLARELFVSTGTIKNWVRKGLITPAITVPVGRQKINYYAPEQIERIITDLKLKRHDDTTQYDDFFEFIEKGDFTFSYKIVMLLSMLKVADNNGECCLDDLLHEYSKFYRHRLESGLKVDRPACPYKDKVFLDDQTKMKRNLLQNPFEKFERKRFMYHAKDLNHIAFSHNLWISINNHDDLNRLKTTYFKSLKDYYQGLEGLPNEAELRKRWNIPTKAIEPGLERMENIIFLEPEKIRKAMFKTALPLVGNIAAGEPFPGFDVENLHFATEDTEWIEVPEKFCNNISFVVRVAGDSMEPTISRGDYLVCEYHRHRQENHNIVIMGDFSTLNAGEVAIKRISESKNAWVFKSDNPEYKEIIVEKTGDGQYPILGTVVYNLTLAAKCY